MADPESFPDREDGAVSDRVTAIRRFHETSSFGTAENLRRQQETAAGLYRSLEPDEARGLARLALDAFEPGEFGITQEILLGLACLRPCSLGEFHEAMVDRRIFYPGVIYHGASPDVAARIVEMLPGDDTNHMLVALAWIGDEVVRDAFRAWRAVPPEWVARLHIPPHRYAEQAGWEMTPQGESRDLFVRGCHPLVEPGTEQVDAGIARVVDDHDEACGWCGRRMATLLDLDLGSPKLAFLGLRGRRLRIATCDVCTCYGTVLTRIDPDGDSSWHGSNRRPDYLPEKVEDWGRLPGGCLVYGERPRHWLEAADWLVPGVRFSQVGGHPTWIQDAEYPRCPECERPMPFVAQVSNEDCQEHAEGIYYMFACPECGVAATTYQQS